MTNAIKEAISKLNEDGLRKQISYMMASNHEYKDFIIKTCEERLDKLNINNALCEDGEVNISEFFQ